MAERQDLGPQTSGPGNGREHDHERRIQIMERNEIKTAAEMAAQRKLYEDLYKELFGDPNRRDEGGEGAFARLEHVIRAESKRRTLRSTRIWQIATGILVGSVLVVGTYLLTLVPHK